MKMSAASILILVLCVVVQANAPAAEPFPPGPATVRLKHADLAAVTFSPDGKLLASAGGGTVILWEGATRKEVQRFQASQRLLQLCFSPDGAGLAGADQRGVQLWQTATGKQMGQYLLERDCDVHALGFSGGGAAVTLVYNR